MKYLILQPSGSRTREVLVPIEEITLVEDHGRFVTAIFTKHTHSLEPLLVRGSVQSIVTQLYRVQKGL